LSYFSLSQIYQGKNYRYILKLTYFDSLIYLLGFDEYEIQRTVHRDIFL